MKPEAILQAAAIVVAETTDRVPASVTLEENSVLNCAELVYAMAQLYGALNDAKEPGNVALKKISPLPFTGAAESGPFRADWLTQAQFSWTTKEAKLKRPAR